MFLNNSLKNNNRNLEETYNAIQKNVINEDCDQFIERKLEGSNMKLTHNINPYFIGLVFNRELIRNQKMFEEDFLNNLKHGGSFEPKLLNKDCHMKSIAFIIPYKNRFENLYVFLYNMHSYLQRQQLKYTIFLVEQINDSPFNKGLINNAAFNEIILNKNPFFKSDNDYFDYDCIMYHDVDLLPTSKYNFCLKFIFKYQFLKVKRH